MKFLIIAKVFFAIVILPAAAQEILKTSVCEVVRYPKRFDNKMVELRATVAGNFEVSAIIDPDNSDCRSLWFTYPGSGPAAYVSIGSKLPTTVRPVVELDRDERFRQFEKMLVAEMHPKDPRTYCIGCRRYEVTSVMRGLVEFAGEGSGFGHLNGFPVQFVLQSIRETSVKDLAPNYSAEEYSTEPVRFPGGTISGTLKGPTGSAIPHAYLKIYSAGSSEEHIERDWASTNEKGLFTFSVPPGRYIIGVNADEPPSKDLPFPPTYYPAANQITGATPIEVADHQDVRNIVFQVHDTLTPRTIPVLVLWPDGKPVSDANVWLSEKRNPRAVVGQAVSHTLTDGTYSLTGFEGIDYILHADKYASLGKVSCASLMPVPASLAVTSPLPLTLSITDFDACQKKEVETH